MKGKFITLEGTDGCGKTTQIQLLYEWLKKKNIKVEQPLRDPGHTALGEEIRRILKDNVQLGKLGMSAEAEILLFEASRAELVRHYILDVLKNGIWVLCDRFYDSTTAYQGYGRGLNLDDIKFLNHFAVGDCIPDLTLVLEIDAREAKQRLGRRPKPVGGDRMESEPESFYEKVREGYRQIAKTEPKRVKLIDASTDPQTVFKKIQKEVQNAFHLDLD